MFYPPFFSPPNGCLQYHTGIDGRFQTFNFDKDIRKIVFKISILLRTFVILCESIDFSKDTCNFLQKYDYTQLHNHIDIGYGFIILPDILN